MTYAASIGREPRARIQILISSLAVVALTSIHHIYGAIVFETPWRLHAVFVVWPVAAVMAIALLKADGDRALNRAFAWVGWVLAVLLPVLMIGMVEGGYNHVVKNLVYFVVGADAAQAMFPAPPYEMPDDFIFEATGILQFPLGLWAGRWGIVLLRELLDGRRSRIRVS